MQSYLKYYITSSPKNQVLLTKKEAAPGKAQQKRRNALKENVLTHIKQHSAAKRCRDLQNIFDMLYLTGVSAWKSSSGSFL
jgi:hypothetical protein